MPSPNRPQLVRGRRLLHGRSGPPPSPPAWLVEEPGGVEEFDRLWRLPSAEVWTEADVQASARLASLYARGGMPGSRNVVAQGQLERRLLLDPIARRHAGVAVEGDVLVEQPGSGGSQLWGTSSFVDEPAQSVVVWDLDGQLLEQFGELTSAGRTALARGQGRAS